MRVVSFAMPVAAVLTLALAACSSSASKSGGSSQPATTPAVSTPATSSPPAVPPSSSGPASASAAGLSGTWAGTYSGAFTGTFRLHWTQHSSDLAGTITLSTAGTAPLNGHVNGSKISFGTVGSAAITYSGTVSGNAMSGTYNAGGATGHWSAHRA